MELDLIWLGFGIAVAGYFIGNGLKNFQTPDTTDSFNEFMGEDDGHELIKETSVHYFMGISKEDAKKLIEEYPDIPHVVINSKVYYPKAKLRQWLSELGE